MKPARTIIVVPAYNEAKRFNSAAFQEFCRVVENVNFLFVDDGSTDRTGELIRELVEANPERYCLRRLIKNSGKAEAVRFGVLEAFLQEPTYIGLWDADLSAPLMEIPRFCEVLDSNSRIVFVSGARVKMMGSLIERSPTRHYVGRLSASLISLVIGLPYYDTQCGAKLFRGNVLMRRAFTDSFSSKWIFDVELIARLHSLCKETPGLCLTDCVYELPLRVWKHKGGSKISLTDYLKSLLDLWRIRWRYF